ncbi:MAG: M1 family peptidase [Acidobacteria bacterium]|nr:MAG: M1 family peptidase [Acidobacteriota bacterium]
MESAEGEPASGPERRARGSLRIARPAMRLRRRRLPERSVRARGPSRTSRSGPPPPSTAPPAMFDDRTMRRPCGTALIVALVAGLGEGAAAAALPPVFVSYAIEVQVDPASRAFRGEERLTWRNPAGVAVSRVPLHLYLNAFANEGSTWLQEARRSGFRRFDLERFHEVFDDPWGWIDLDAVRTEPAGEEVPWRPVQPDDGNPLDRSLVELRLPRPVPPDGLLTLRISFSGRLPRPFARTGCVDRYCLVGQWFPKVAVLEPKGTRGAERARWAARQFHAATEFYADFADYDVTIEAPAGWLVAATGRREGDPIATDRGTLRHRFRQRAVHDFAFVVARDFEEIVSEHDPPGPGGPVELHYVLPHEFADQLPRWRTVAEATLDLLGRRVGPYPYRTLTIVLPRLVAERTAGMEYPTFVVASTVGRELEAWPLRATRIAEHTLAHELIHQYFYGLVASNEQEEAFLDEGFTTYWTARVAESLYGAGRSLGSFFGRPLGAFDLARLGLAYVGGSIREPLRKRPSALFAGRTHAVQFYARTAVTLATMERMFGRDTADRIFREYFRANAFRHPSVEDFLAAARRAAGEEAQGFLREAFGRARLPELAVTRLESHRVEVPLGSWPAPEGRITVDRSSRHEHADLLDLPLARDSDGKIWLEITDPGWFREDSHRDGTVRWIGFEPVELPEPGGDGVEPKLFESEAVLEGPGWDHLPVTVRLRFADGAVVVDRWDGRSPWRGYRAIRRARLEEVIIDPGDAVLLDPSPETNGRRARPDSRWLADWAGWAGALAAWVASGVSLWF